MYKKYNIENVNSNFKLTVNQVHCVNIGNINLFWGKNEEKTV